MDPKAYGPPTGLFRLVEPPRILTAAATSVSFTGLKGNQSKIYRFFCRIISAGAAAVITIEPNGVSTDQFTRSIENAAAGSTATLRIGEVETTQSCFIDGMLWAKTGASRYFVSRAMISSTRVWSSGGQWNESSTEITSLNFVCNVAANMAAGSEFQLLEQV